MFSFTLYITTDCNLKCQYCYEDYHNHYQLNEKTLVDSLEFIMNYGDRGKVLIDFLGGEPLLADCHPKRPSVPCSAVSV